MVTIRQGNLGSIERISMTARNHQVDTSRASEAAAHLEESTISLKFISLTHSMHTHPHLFTQKHGVHSIKKYSLHIIDRYLSLNPPSLPLMLIDDNKKLIIFPFYCKKVFFSCERKFVEGIGKEILVTAK